MQDYRPTPYDRASLDARLEAARKLQALTGMPVFDCSSVIATIGSEHATELAVRELMENR